MVSLCVTVRLLVLTIMKEIKPVVTEKHFSVTEMNHFFNNFLEKLDYQDFDVMVKINSYQIEQSCTGAHLSIETLLEQIKPERKEINEIELRPKSIK